MTLVGHLHLLTAQFHLRHLDLHSEVRQARAVGGLEALVIETHHGEFVSFGGFAGRGLPEVEFQQGGALLHDVAAMMVDLKDTRVDRRHYHLLEGGHYCAIAVYRRVDVTTVGG